MADFFISYTSADRAWAEWIGYVLEEKGFSVIIQAWDFRPGSNFVLEMQKAAADADRTIMVLSPDYLKSQFASSEWAAAFAQDPMGLNASWCRLWCGLVASWIVDAPCAYCLDGEDEVRKRELLIDGVNAKRAKPPRRPHFQGYDKPPHESFPDPYHQVG